jgi:predicted nucleic acid-binding protein
VLRNAVRRGRCDEEYVDRSLDRLWRLPITVDSETDAAAWGATRALARELGLTLYDAAYLEVAKRLGLTLASCDQALLIGAAASGVETLPK